MHRCSPHLTPSDASISHLLGPQVFSNGGRNELKGSPVTLKNRTRQQRTLVVSPLSQHCLHLHQRSRRGLDKPASNFHGQLGLYRCKMLREWRHNVFVVLRQVLDQISGGPDNVSQHFLRVYVRTSRGPKSWSTHAITVLNISGVWLLTAKKRRESLPLSLHNTISFTCIKT